LLLLCSIARTERRERFVASRFVEDLVVYTTCTLNGTTGTSASEWDSYGDENAPTTNNGTAVTMNSQSRNNRNRRSYVSIDLTTCAPNVPSSATVTNATLRLWVTAMPVAACRTEDVFAVTSAWTESRSRGTTSRSAQASTTLRPEPGRIPSPSGAGPDAR
jgi:hypothetical protein